MFYVTCVSLKSGEDQSTLEDPLEASSNDSSLMEADDILLQAMESDEDLWVEGSGGNKVTLCAESAKPSGESDGYSEKN